MTDLEALDKHRQTLHDLKQKQPSEGWGTLLNVVESLAQLVAAILTKK